MKMVEKPPEDDKKATVPEAESSIPSQSIERDLPESKGHQGYNQKPWASKQVE